MAHRSWPTSTATAGPRSASPAPPATSCSTATARCAGGVRTSDRSSNATGSTAFDLDGDGTLEIIYRDEYFLRIYRGSDGLLLSKVPVSSATWAEVPTVADVDNDGHADILVSSDLGSGATDTGVLVIHDALNLWTRTRRIWNQHAYHVTNVGETGTIPVTETPHWLLPGLNAFRTNAFAEGEAADASDGFTYVASDGVLQSNVGTVRIAVRPVNAPPRFTSSAITTAAPDVVYTYAVRALDPDAGDVLTYALTAAPSGMSIDAASGLVRWTPGAAQQGPQEIVVKVVDARGLFALQGYTLHVGAAVAVPDVVGQAQAAAEGVIEGATLAVGGVSTRHSPTVPAGAVVTQAPAAGTLVATGAAVSLVVSTGPAPAGTVPDVVGQAQSSAQADIVAAQFVVGAVTGQSSATVPAGVVLAQTPAAGTLAATGSPIALVVSFGRPPGTLDLDGDGYTGDGGDCNDTNAAINPGAFDIPGDGIDQNCNGVDSVPGDATPPTATLVTPDDLAEITMPTDILGTVGDPNLLRYTVQMAEVDATTFTTIGSGTAAVTAGVVGRLDPTLLENGLYRVRLVAEDVNGQTAVDERVYRVDGDMKVGVTRLSFTDLRVPVSGIPISVERHYDSRVKSGRDFGIGWTLEVKTGTYRHNRPPGEGWIIRDQPFLGDFLPCVGGSLETRSHLTEVRLSDREVYRFALEVVNGTVGISNAVRRHGPLPLRGRHVARSHAPDSRWNDRALPARWSRHRHRARRLHCQHSSPLRTVAGQAGHDRRASHRSGSSGGSHPRRGRQRERADDIGGGHRAQQRPQHRVRPRSRGTDHDHHRSARCHAGLRIRRRRRSGGVYRPDGSGDPIHLRRRAQSHRHPGSARQSRPARGVQRGGASHRDDRRSGRPAGLHARSRRSRGGCRQRQRPRDARDL